MKKKLIAIVTSLAMVATMVPATAFAATSPAQAKAVAQTQSLSVFTDALAKVPEASAIKAEAEADNALSKYRLAVNEYEALTAGELDLVTDSQKQKMKDVKATLVAIYADLMAGAIKEKSKAGKVTATDSFEKIAKYENKLKTDLELKDPDVKEAVGLYQYEWYETAKVAKTVADQIAKASNLVADSVATVKTAVDTLETTEPFKSASEAARTMAVNYHIYLEAKEKLAAAERADTLLKGYADRFDAQKNLLVDGSNNVKNTVTAADIADAQALLDEADGSIAVERALDAANTHVSTYQTAHKNLYEAMNNANKAKDALAEKEAVAEVSALVTKVGVVSANETAEMLKKVAELQELYEIAKGTTDPEYVANKTAIDAAVGELDTYLKSGLDNTAKGTVAKAVVDAYDKLVPTAGTVKLDDEALLDQANDVLVEVTSTSGDATLVGNDISTFFAQLDATDTVRYTALKNRLANAQALLTDNKAEETRIAGLFVKAVADLNGMAPTAAEYEAKLKAAKAQYEALDPAFKEGGSLYAEPLFTAAGATGSVYSVKNVCENANATAGVGAELTAGNNYIPETVTASAAAGTYSLRTMQLSYQKRKDTIAQENQFKELIDGIAALPAADKLTLDNQDAVYALQDKRDAMTEESQDAFKDDHKEYNDKLDAAIAAIDALVTNSVMDQIDALTKIKPYATAEEIAAAKAANKAAREAYEALTDSQKKIVINYGFLQDAEAAVAAAEVQYAIDQMAAVLEGVDVENMTLEQAKAILEVKDMIDDLTAAQKADIEKDKNYAAFQAAAKAARDVREENPSGPSDLIGVSKIATQVYTGKAITPNPVVKAEGKTLVKDTDYTVKYAKNTNIGEATVTISGIGAYKGTITTHFIIKPAKEKLTSVKAGKKQITLRYTAQKANGKTGYRIVYSAAKGQARAINAYTTKATVKGLKSGKTYKVKVRAFKTINGTQYTGTYSAVKKVKVK